MRGNGNVLRVRTTICQTEHLISLLELSLAAGSQLLDGSLEFNSHGLGGLRRQRVQAFALQQVHAVEAKGLYFYESLRGADFGHGSVGVDEHVLDWAFATLDVWRKTLGGCISFRFSFVFVKVAVAGLTDCSHGRHVELIIDRI